VLGQNGTELTLVLAVMADRYLLTVDRMLLADLAQVAMERTARLATSEMALENEVDCRHRHRQSNLKCYQQ